jgi:hypothetical protein
MFFVFVNLDEAELDSILLSSELDEIPTSFGQYITNLDVGVIIGFVDNYRKKGLVRITELEPGFNNNDFIVFDVKVQP